MTLRQPANPKISPCTGTIFSGKQAMAEFPALPIFTDAYIADTRHLSAAQHGAYLLLLMMAWRLPECGVPDDDTKLARWAAMDRRTWLKNKAEVMAFWYLEGNIWYQKRLLDERKHSEHVRNTNAAAGRSSALKRLNRGSTTVSTNPQRTGNPLPIPIEKEVAKATSQKKGTRIPEDFAPDTTCHALAEKLLYDTAESQLAFDEFMDYWRSVPGSRGVKLDWQATFRNSLRNRKRTRINGKATGHSREHAFAVLDAIVDEAERRKNGEPGGEETAGELAGHGEDLAGVRRRPH